MSFTKGASQYTSIEMDELVERARCGDANAFSDLLTRHTQLIRRTAFSILRNPDDADDVVQDVALSVWRKLHTFQGDSAFSTWLTRIAINSCLQKLRQQRRRPACSLEAIVEEDTVFLPLADQRPGPEQQCFVQQGRLQLERAVAMLPRLLQEVAMDCLYEELPMLEVSKKRGISMAATKSRAYRARKRLMVLMQGHTQPLQTRAA